MDLLLLFRRCGGYLEEKGLAIALQYVYIQFSYL
jgi:hypothetical protein